MYVPVQVMEAPAKCSLGLSGVPCQCDPFQYENSLILQQMNKCIICAQPAVKWNTIYFETVDRRRVIQLHRLITHEEILIRASACYRRRGSFRLHCNTVVFSLHIEQTLIMGHAFKKTEGNIWLFF